MFDIRLAAAVAFVGPWWIVLWWQPTRDMDVRLLAALLVLTSVAAGRFTGSWWAMLLPLLIVPVFALPSAYTPGGSPNYSVGLFAACGPVLIAVPGIAAGVIVNRLAS